MTSAPRLALSSLNWTPDTPAASVALADTVMVPATIAPEAGAVMETGSKGGVMRKARSTFEFAVQPTPAICPASLSAEPLSHDQPEPDGVGSAKNRTAPSRNVYSWSQAMPSQYVHPWPRTCPDALMASAALKPSSSARPVCFDLPFVIEIA